jgi:hypothetical protein
LTYHRNGSSNFFPFFLTKKEEGGNKTQKKYMRLFSAAIHTAALFVVFLLSHVDGHRSSAGVSLLSRTKEQRDEER